VKTSILVLDRIAARRTPSILFSEIKHIGVSLGVKRTPSEHNDLPAVLRDYRAFYDGGELSHCSWLATREEILANECNLTGSRYRPGVVNGDRRLVKVADVCSITKGTASSTTTPPGPYPLILTAAEPKTSATYQFDGPAVCIPLISSLGHGKAALHRIHFASGKFALANLLVALQPNDESELDARFLYHALDLKRADIAALMRGAANVSMKPEDLAQFDIPLPPLEVQKEIVAEIEGYQKVINGARAVLDNYRPHIPIRPAWPLVELGKVCEINPEAINPISAFPNLTVFYIDISSVENETGRFLGYSEIASSDAPSRARRGIRGGDVLLSTVRPNLKAFTLLNGVRDRAIASTGFAVLRARSGVAEPAYILASVCSDHAVNQMVGLMGKGAYPSINQSDVAAIRIPLPPLAIQQAIVAEIEAEQALVAANRDLIARFEKKIKATLARVWGEEVPTVTEA
jgi:type I restriction enzyme M protein